MSIIFLQRASQARYKGVVRLWPNIKVEEPVGGSGFKSMHNGKYKTIFLTPPTIFSKPDKTYNVMTIVTKQIRDCTRTLIPSPFRQSIIVCLCHRLTERTEVIGQSLRPCPPHIDPKTLQYRAGRARIPIKFQGWRTWERQMRGSQG